MEFAIILTVACFLVGFWNLAIAIWGSFRENRIKTVGTLAKVSHHKNLHTRYGFVPNWCDCVYVYCVRGKTYKLRVGEKKNKNALLKKVEIVYIKGFPRRAGIGTYQIDEAFVIAGSLLLLGLFLLIVVLFL